MNINFFSCFNNELNQIKFHVVIDHNFSGTLWHTHIVQDSHMYMSTAKI